MKRGKDEFSIIYAGVSSVNLDRGSDKIFKTVLHLEGHRPLLITNKYYTSERAVEDRSRAYSTFIRVLHYHLKDKSKASYAYGTRRSRLGLSVSFAAALAFGISFTAEFMGVSIFNAYVQGAILAALMATAILFISVRHWPRNYNPAEIPLEFLP